ncbi:hypothetical protein [uncultured Tenacibaculum sp.]|uniref:hypothetical protein n=1 Tax=uncultured Tenacibaculum sp. TaxID=174713 RepID=UPI002619E6BA|nr:hypothetical protein [uncultured Tenacibaculum sp.]
MTEIILAVIVLIGAGAFITVSIKNKSKNKQSNIKIGRDGDVVGGDKKMKNVKK